MWEDPLNDYYTRGHGDNEFGNGEEAPDGTSHICAERIKSWRYTNMRKLVDERRPIYTSDRDIRLSQRKTQFFK